MKLPRNLKGPAIADLNYRLKALPQSLQMPKGPMPDRPDAQGAAAQFR